MSIGFRIKKLIVTGINAEDALIAFNNSSHAIIGPSNTGKSYVFQCIKYLLGSTKKPKKIKESYGYDYCYLEIALSDNSVHTIKRSLSGGHAIIYKCRYSEIVDHTSEPEKFLVGRKATKKNKTFNSYLLSITNLSNIKVRRNKGGVTDLFAFSFLRHLILIDEISIIKEDSPAYTGQNNEAPKEESVLRILLTGKDDGNLIAKPKQKVIDNRKGRLEVINELIAAYQSELDEYNNNLTEKNEVEDQVEKLIESIKAITSELNSSYEKIDEYDSTIDKYWNSWKEKESRLITINELLSRLELLDTHYSTDISRLESLQEASSAYTNLEIGLCPTCNSEYNLDNHNTCNSTDIENIQIASAVEINKITSLRKELNKTRSNLKNEKIELDLSIDSLRTSHNDYQYKKSEFTKKYIQETNEKLELYRSTLRDKQQALKIIGKVKELSLQKIEYEVEIDPMDGDYEFDELTTSVTSEFCSTVQELLKEWGYSENTRVSFSEESCDFVIDGFDRNLAGKGYRALSYAAFSIGLMHTCLKNGFPHSGFVLLDSPLCTLRSKHVKDDSKIQRKDIISDKTKESFYKSISSYKGKGQVIILDNDGPDEPDSLDLGYTEFTEDWDHGRYGFFTQYNGS
ncbi:AAA family ATPase [Oceanimonas doudoroffii]|uniref:AAA family ATPase n=1 Tax=Oceanimonas doudoroffii TaxID=84158 RepID=UPI0011405715|nr:AAA family ATPase [Oceanimonas doudoroffii]